MFNSHKRKDVSSLFLSIEDAHIVVLGDCSNSSDSGQGLTRSSERTLCVASQDVTRDISIMITERNSISVQYIIHFFCEMSPFLLDSSLVTAFSPVVLIHTRLDVLIRKLHLAQ